jgi:hypothetical protein
MCQEGYHPAEVEGTATGVSTGSANDVKMCSSSFGFFVDKINPYFTPDITGEPLTNRNISYIKVFAI